MCDLGRGKYNADFRNNSRALAKRFSINEERCSPMLQSRVWRFVLYLKLVATHCYATAKLLYIFRTSFRTSFSECKEGQINIEETNGPTESFRWPGYSYHPRRLGQPFRILVSNNRPY